MPGVAGSDGRHAAIGRPRRSAASCRSRRCAASRSSSRRSITTVRGVPPVPTLVSSRSPRTKRIHELARVGGQLEAAGPGDRHPALQLVERDAHTGVVQLCECGLDPVLADGPLDVAELDAGVPEQRKVRALGMREDAVAKGPDQRLLAAAEVRLDCAASGVEVDWLRSQGPSRRAYDSVAARLAQFLPELARRAGTAATVVERTPPTLPGCRTVSSPRSRTGSCSARGWRGSRASGPCFISCSRLRFCCDCGSVGWWSTGCESLAGRAPTSSGGCSTVPRSPRRAPRRARRTSRSSGSIPWAAWSWRRRGRLIVPSFVLYRGPVAGVPPARASRSLRRNCRGRGSPGSASGGATGRGIGRARARWRSRGDASDSGPVSGCSRSARGGVCAAAAPCS